MKPLRRIYKRRPVLSVLIAAGLVLVLTNWLPLPEWLARWSDKLGQPLTRIGQAMAADVSAVIHAPNQTAKINELEQQNADLSAQLAGLYQLESENTQLRSLLGFSAEHKLATLAASITSFDADPIRRLARIDKGASDQLVIGDVVMAAGGLLGVLARVDSHTSVVMLITDPEFRATIKIAPSGAPGVAAGAASGGIGADHLPVDKSIKSGDLVLTSGLDGAFPPGLLVGRVSTINVSVDGLFKNVQIATLVDPSQAAVVLVIKNRP